MIKLSLSQAWDETRAIAAREGGLLASVALALLVLPSTIAGAVNPGAMTSSVLPETKMLLMWLVVLLIGTVGRLAVIRLALGPSTSVGDAIGHGLRRLLPAVAALMLFVLPVSVALTPFLLRVMQSPTAPPPGAALAMLVIVIAGFVLGVRLMLLVLPVAAAEPIGPIAILRRSWRLSSGNWWRLAVFVILFFLASAVVTSAVSYLVGIPAGLLSGPIAPMSVGALLLSVVLALAQAAFAVAFSVMLARIYAQLAGPGEAAAGVPTSGS
jgi:hypothetical protein